MRCRAGGRCEICYDWQGVGNGRLCVHHIDPSGELKEGAHDIIALCHLCHGHQHSNREPGTDRNSPKDDAAKMIGCIDADLCDQLDQLAREESVKQGRPVSRKELVEKAVRAELAKHARRAREQEREAGR